MGRDDAWEICNAIETAIAASSGQLRLPDARFTKLGVYGPVLRVYLDIEWGVQLSADYWNGFAQACYYKYHSGSGTYPFYASAYAPPGVNGVTDQVLSTAATSNGDTQCHGIWSSREPYCQCYPGRPWEIQTCANVPGPYHLSDCRPWETKVWQTAVDVRDNNTGYRGKCAPGGPCWPQLPYTPDGSFDIDQTIPIDNEAHYMLFIGPSGPSDIGSSWYANSVSHLFAYRITRSDPFRNFDTAQRCEMAGFICRAIPSSTFAGWEGKTWDNEDWSWDPSTNFTDLGGVHPDLVRNIRTLKHYGVANGYGDGRFGPYDQVNKAQVISFMTRAMVTKGYWSHLAGWDPGYYPQVGWNTGHRQDVLTYHRYIGSIPEASTGSWPNWTDPAPRQWFAEVEWRAVRAAGL